MLLLKIALLCFAVPLLVSSKPILEEDINLYQKTHIHREKRATGYYVDYPENLKCTVAFRGQEIFLILQRQFGMKSLPALFDSSGEIGQEKKRCIALYQDVSHLASVSVVCEEATDSCIMQGSIVLDGALWHISADQTTSTNATYRARRSVGGKHALNDFIHKLKNEEAVHKERRRRDIPNCRIVELMAFVDFSIWEFWLSETGNKVFESERRLREYYISFYNQVDMLYQMIPVYSNYKDLCIRIYLAGIYISKSPEDSSWSFNNEYHVNPSMQVVNGRRAIMAFKNYAASRLEGHKVDYCQGITRLNLELRSNYDVRGLAYVGTMCNDNFRAYRLSLIEDLGDSAVHVAAREIGNSLGARDDSKTLCKNDRNYIMSSFDYPGEKYASNRFKFSDCAINTFRAHLKREPSCLMKNSFDAAEWDDEKARGTPEFMSDFNFQCRQKFGQLSSFCGKPMDYPVDMCSSGIDCLDVRTGKCRKVRVFEQTPCGTQQLCKLGTCQQISTTAITTPASLTVTSQTSPFPPLAPEMSEVTTTPAAHMNPVTSPPGTPATSELPVTSPAGKPATPAPLVTLPSGIPATPAPPVTSPPVALATPAPPVTSPPETPAMSAPLVTSLPGTPATPAPPVTSLPGASATPASPVTSPPGAPATPAPPVTSPPGTPAMPAPLVTSPPGAPATPAPPVTSPPGTPATPAPPVTSPPVASATPAPPVTSPPETPATPAPPVTSPPVAPATPAPPVTSLPGSPATPAPPVSSLPRAPETPTPPVTSPSGTPATPAPPVTSSPGAPATPTPPVTSPPRAPATPSPPVTSPLGTPATPAPPVTSPPGAPATPAPPVTSPSGAPAMPAPPVTSLPGSPATPAPPVSSLPRAPETPTPPVTSPPRTPATPVPPITSSLGSPATPAPPVTSSLGAPETPTPPVTPPPRASATPSPPFTSPLGTPATPAPPVTSPPGALATPAPPVTSPPGTPIVPAYSVTAPPGAPAMPTPP